MVEYQLAYFPDRYKRNWSRSELDVLTLLVVLCTTCTDEVTLGRYQAVLMTQLCLKPNQKESPVSLCVQDLALIRWSGAISALQFILNKIDSVSREHFVITSFTAF